MSNEKPGPVAAPKIRDPWWGLLLVPLAILPIIGEVYFLSTAFARGEWLWFILGIVLGPVCWIVGLIEIAHRFF